MVAHTTVRFGMPPTESNPAIFQFALASRFTGRPEAAKAVPPGTDKRNAAPSTNAYTKRMQVFIKIKIIVIYGKRRTLKGFV
jgi:hypothetical protein